MKSLRIIFATLNLGAALVAAPAFAKDVHGGLSQFNMTVCTEGQVKCLQLKTLKAEGSQFSPVFAFEKAEVTWVENKKAAGTETFTGGHLDLAMNRVVLISEENKVSSETVISLDNLTVQKFKLD